MSERKYSGKPLDATYQHISEKDGETVDATPVDSGELKTELGGKTPLAEKIIDYAMKNPNADTREIANQVGCSHVYVWRLVNRQSDTERYAKKSIDELSQKAAKIVYIRAADENKSQKQIAEQIGVSGAYVSKVIQSNQHLIEQAKDELSEVL